MVSFPQEASKTREDQLLKNLHYNNGKLTLLPFNGNSSHVLFELTTRTKKSRDTSYWGLNLKEFNIFKIHDMQVGSYIISNDTIFHMSDNQIKSGYVLKDSLLFGIRDVHLGRNLSLILDKQDSIKSIIKSRLDIIKKDYRKNRSATSESEIVEISDIYIIEGGNALVVFSLSSNNGLNQELYLYQGENSDVSRIQFPKPIYRLYDFNGKKVIGQYEVGGGFFTSEIDLSDLKCSQIIELDEIKGDYKYLKFTSKETVIGLKREPFFKGPLPIFSYNIGES